MYNSLVTLLVIWNGDWKPPVRVCRIPSESRGRVKGGSPWQRVGGPFHPPPLYSILHIVVVRLVVEERARAFHRRRFLPSPFSRSVSTRNNLRGNTQVHNIKDRESLPVRVPSPSWMLASFARTFNSINSLFCFLLLWRDYPYYLWNKGRSPDWGRTLRKSTRSWPIWRTWSIHC